MLNSLSNTFLSISKGLRCIADFTLYAFVSIGVCDLFFNGARGAPSATIGACVIFMLLSVFFYIVAFSCRLVVKLKRSKVYQ